MKNTWAGALLERALFGKRAGTVGAPLRGRVHKVSIVAGGEVSVVLRFGIDEPAARELNQGALCGLVVGDPIPEAKAPAALEAPAAKEGA